MTGIQQVQVHPIDWLGWQPNDRKAYTVSRYLTDDNRLIAGPSHELRELGETSNGYKYKVYYNSAQLLSATIRPECCKDLPKCPIGRDTVRLNPCRQHLRDEAKRMAYDVWVQYMRDLGAANIPPANTGDTDT
jgi:hypothetical protein